MLTVLYFYISTFRSMCAVPNMAVFCSSLISCFPGMLLSCYSYYNYCRDTMVATVTRLRAGQTGFRFPSKPTNFLFYKTSRPSLGTPSLAGSGYRLPFPAVKDRKVKLDTLFRLVPLNAFIASAGKTLHYYYHRHHHHHRRRHHEVTPSNSQFKIYNVR